jgi:hypothetical protein
MYAAMRRPARPVSKHFDLDQYSMDLYEAQSKDNAEAIPKPADKDAAFEQGV